jgi:hypothetical protein
MALSNPGDQDLVVIVVDLGRVHIVSEVLASNLSTINNGLFGAISLDKLVHYSIANVKCFVTLPRVAREFPSRVSDDPKVCRQRSGLEIDRNDICLPELICTIFGRRLNIVPNGISEHAIAGHFNVEDVSPSISKGVGEDPFCSVTASQTMDDLTTLRPYHSFIACIPMKLEVVHLSEMIRNGEVDFEPMRSPARTKGLADMGWSELMGGGVFERGTSKIGRGVDFEFDPFVSCGTAFVELTRWRSDIAHWNCTLRSTDD